LYEQRLNRTLEKALAQLKQLQKERADAEAHALEAAARIYKLKEALKQTWQPEENGFEFSSAQLTAWISRRRLTREANDFELLGQLPPSGGA